MSSIRLFCLCALALISAGALALDESQSQGTPGTTASDAPAQLSIHGGLIQFTPPPEPFRMTEVKSFEGKGAMYREPGGAAIRVYSMATKAPRNDGEAKFMSDGIVQRIIIDRRNSPDLKIVQTPAAVKDDRFDLLVTETWENKSGSTSGQWHYYQYRNTRPHLFIVTFAAPLADETHVTRLREMAEKIVVEGSLVPKGTNPPPPPDPKKVAEVEGNDDDDDDDKGKPDDDDVKKPASSPAVEAAQKALDDAIASADAQLGKNPEYARLKKSAEDAQQRLTDLRQADPPDRTAIANASKTWIEAKGKVEALRKAAHAKDPAIIEAKRRLDDAKGHRPEARR
jgi:hypothetical protein